MGNNLANRTHPSENKDMISENQKAQPVSETEYAQILPTGFAANLAQSEAAAFAVLAAAVRQRINEDRQDSSYTEDMHNCAQEMCNFLRVLEEASIESIAANDGNIVHWIGVAAKQMNPLLS